MVIVPRSGHDVSVMFLQREQRRLGVRVITLDLTIPHPPHHQVVVLTPGLGCQLTASLAPTPTCSCCVTRAGVCIDQSCALIGVRGLFHAIFTHKRAVLLCLLQSSNEVTFAV